MASKALGLLPTGFTLYSYRLNLNHQNLVAELPK